jgi:fructosamine-3-kinase
MRYDVLDTLASQFDTYRIVRQLHDVPPHEVYEVYVDGQRAVYKTDTGSTGSAATEGRVTTFVGERTSVPVPEILLVGDEYYVAAWHPDAPAPNKGGEVDERWASIAGRGMARLHAETDPLTDEYGQFHSQNGDIAIAGHSDWHAVALAYVRRYRSVADRHGYADTMDAVVEFLNDRPDLFEGVGGPVCCHGWATPEHVSIRGDQVGCMVDFEHAIAAPGEFDYWRTILPTFSHESDTMRQAFRDGYESLRSLPTGFEDRKPIYILLNEIYYIESLYIQNQHGPEKTAERAEWIRSSIVEKLDNLS